jgi:hypothetical protein
MYSLPPSIDGSAYLSELREMRRRFCANAHLFRSARTRSARIASRRLARNSESSAAGGHFSKLPRCINNRRLRAVRCANGDNNENKKGEGVDFNLRAGATDMFVALAR